MKQFLAGIFVFVAIALHAGSDYPIQPVPFTEVRLTHGLLHDRQATNSAVTVSFALDQCESSGRLKNFDLAAEVMRRRAGGETSFQIKPPTQFPFDDSDVYKAIEGAAFCLSVQPDPALAARLEQFIQHIAAAQEPDGYLYTFRTMHPDSPGHGWINQERWLNDPKLSHELYNLGHLYEAGFAHAQATGSRSLLDICLKSADLLQKDFGDGEPRIAPGHEVIEMGLTKLYRQTGDQRWLNLCKFFLDNRGHGSEYSQDHKPVVEQDKAVGHAVRANYLYSGMADYAALSGDQRYLAAITKIWDNVVSAKLHLTGGCGARANGEAYGNDYELPSRCYNETCAAVAFLFWNHRMFLMTGDAKYMDVYERSLYNGVLSGVSLSGDLFFYPNPLEYDGHTKNNHGFAGRAPWFGCACCPPNVLRTLAALGGDVYAVQNDKLFVNLYAQGEATATVVGNQVKLEQTTSYPWDGKIKLRLTPEKPGQFTLCLRIPGWVEGKPLPSDLYTYDDAKPSKWTLKVNGKKMSFTTDPTRESIRSNIERDGERFSLSQRERAGVRENASNNPNAPASHSSDQASSLAPSEGERAGVRGSPEIQNGFALIPREWKSGDEVTLNLPMPVHRVVGNPKIAGTRNQVALERGPIVYAFEGIDNNDSIFDAVLPAAAKITPEHRKGFLGGVTVLKIKGAERATLQGSGKTTPANLLAIPYATWANRGLTPMAVWLARDAATARPTPKPTFTSQVKVAVSFARDGMSLAPINDQLMPQNATDGFAPDFDFWPHKGTAEWLSYEFAKPTPVKSITVSWFDDTGTGECRLPVSWRILYRTDADQWEPVKNASAYTIKKRDPIKVTFAPITTKALRLEVQLPKDFSSGLYEWEVE